MSENALAKTIGANIKLHRVKMNISQTTLSDFVELTQTQVSAIERGASMPKITTLMKLAEVFGTKVDDLLH